jgi:hypothetical protein
VWWCSAALGLEGLYSTPSTPGGTAAASAASSAAAASHSSGSGAAPNGGGKVYHMVTYVPIDAASDTSTQVRLDLFQTEYDNRKRSASQEYPFIHIISYPFSSIEIFVLLLFSIRMGSCWVPLVKALNKDIWLPVIMVESYAFSEAGWRCSYLHIYSVFVSFFWFRRDSRTNRNMYRFVGPRRHGSGELVLPLDADL